MSIAGLMVFLGPWWCPKCSRALDEVATTNLGEPCCPGCGTLLEEAGTGDDDTGEWWE